MDTPAMTPPAPCQAPRRLWVLPLVALLIAWHASYLAFAAYPSSFPAIFARGLLWLAAMGLAFLLVSVSLAWPLQRRAVTFVLLVSLPAWAGQWYAGMSLALHARFALIRSSLDADVRLVQAGRPPVGWASDPVELDNKRAPATSAVAFVDGGILDNWSGFIYDPSSVPGCPTPGILNAASDLASARTISGFTKLTPPAGKMFGGDMVGVLRLGGGWFYCWFT